MPSNESVFVKFHWNPAAGTHSLVWDEAVKISGADSDFHRRDLWEAIEAGAFPEWELGVQVITEEQAEQFSFDVLDATKIVPEGACAGDAGRPHGPEPQSRQLLRGDRTGRVLHGATSCPASTSRTIRCSPAASIRTSTRRSRGSADRISTRCRSTRRSRRSTTTQRDGMHRQTINRGRVAYEPNSLGGGCPFQAGKMGFMYVPGADGARG